jgi:CBS domain-containing protein/gamma-glutamyl:cysteine ligase YbdK (ATP-grasp superfamily)
MGDQDVRQQSDQDHLRLFTRALLDDLSALQRMLEGDQIESGIRRVGAEQELFLIDRSGGPSNKAVDILKRIEDPRFTTELARFNLEANLTPRVFGRTCLREMEQELREVHAIADDAADAEGADTLMVGILPTLTPAHLAMEWMTPNPRYYELNRALTDLSGGEFRAVIKGMDELRFRHDNVMLEACNTSFQVHFQVGPSEFANLYNVAQAVTAPVLAAAVNSPVLLRHRLWHESRIALFEQSVDTRSDTKQIRGKRGRVSFGTRWVDRSVLDIFQEDVSTFRVLLGQDLGEASTALLDRGVLPPLRSLMLFNGTVYRWNRPCYGVADGVAHLRIENRVLPSGPTIADEMANAAFFFGMMAALADEYDDISRSLEFDVAKENFYAAARYGLQARFRWFGNQVLNADELILTELVPAARQGLLSHDVASEDVDRYMGIIEERVRSGQTGSRWILDSIAGLGVQGKEEERYRAVTSAMAERQASGKPVHTWDLARIDEVADWRQSFRSVAQVMTKDMRTVHPEDVVDLAASLMDWEKLRWLPVEDDEGHLVGLVTHRTMLRLFTSGRWKIGEPLAIREVMHTDPVSISPELSTLDAISTMRDKAVGCLPVVDDTGKLVGIITERDFIDISAQLLEATLIQAEAEDAWAKVR